MDSKKISGWFLDACPDAVHGAQIWLLGDDGTRYFLHHPMPVTFFASGPERRLSQLLHVIRSHWQASLRTAFTTRRDLFTGEIRVLGISARANHVQRSAFFRLQEKFPDLNYFDADVPFGIRYAAVNKVLPLSRCKARLSGDRLLEIEKTDSGDPLGISLPRFRLLHLAPDRDPEYLEPEEIQASIGGEELSLSLEDPAAFVARFASLLEEYDPDIILSKWGDTWIFPRLLDWADQYRIAFNPNRGPVQQITRRKAFSYHTYGQVLHRGQQVHLAGRWHIDQTNAIMYGEYQLSGILEQASITGLPVQEVARKSPGAGITAIQMITAMRSGILVPYHKSQVESFKTPAQLITADRGGLVGQPQSGVHYRVAGIDFFSMYPQIMSRYNISPETLGKGHSAETIPVPGTHDAIDQNHTGLIGKTLQALLDRRLTLKRIMSPMSPIDRRYYDLKSRTNALKWLLVVCFGYLGHKHFRWMKIEAHEAVTAFGREMVARAKQIAEEHGFRVLYFNVDGLYVQKQGAVEPRDFVPLLKDIQARTGLLINLDGIYRWIVFLPSRTNSQVPVANRYFGLLEGGKIKVRGIEMRRHDTPPFVYKAQARLLQLLANTPEGQPLAKALPAAIAFLKQTAAELRTGNIPPEDLIVTQRLSRDLHQYRQPSPAARAAAQLAGVDKPLSAGQAVHFLYIRQSPGVLAWRVGLPYSYQDLDIPEYLKLLARAAGNVLSPLGVEESAIMRALGVAGQIALFKEEFELAVEGEGRITVLSAEKFSNLGVLEYVEYPFGNS